MNPRRPKTQRANVLGMALVLVALAALGGLAAIGMLMRPAPTDADTLCRTDQPLGAHTLILVDATDRLEPRHRRKLRAVLDEERAQLAEYERLTLARLNPRRPQEPTILFSKCLPTPPERANPLFEGARTATRRWEEGFANALDSALGRAQSGRGASTSPILSGIRAAAADPDFSAAIPRRRLVLASDLLEHDQNGFSLYVANATFDAWRQVANFGPADLSAVDVRVVPLDRPEHAERQAAALGGFWPLYFQQAGAESVAFDPLP